MNLTTGLLFACGIILISVICTKTRKMGGVYPPSSEGFKMPKMPSVADITRPVLTPMRSMEKGITKQFGKITQKIKGIEDKIVGGFKKIFDIIKQAISFVMFFPTCFLWYSLNIVGYVIYAPIAFFVWIFGMHRVEKLVFSYIEFADKWAHQLTGVHLFHFSDEIQARCYFSKSSMRDLRREKKAGANTGGWSLNDPSIDDSETMGYFVFIILVGVAIVLGLSAI
jgi:hypothetical protein